MMRFRLPVNSNTSDYMLHFNDDVWQQVATGICARYRLASDLRKYALRLAPEAIHLTLDELEAAIWTFATH